MGEPRGDVQVLSLADATGVWAVRTDDGLTYFVDADAGALRLRKPPPGFDKVFGRGWLRITTVRGATSDQVGVVRVGVAHRVGLVAADDAEAEAEAFHALSTVRAIRPATDEEIGGLALRLGGLPRGVFLTGGRTELSLADEVGVWAVHGRADERVVFLDIDSWTVLSEPWGEAGRWSRLDRFRGARAAPPGVVRAGDRAVFEADGLPTRRVRLESVTLVRRVLDDELATLPARCTRRPVTSRVVLPAGQHVVLELPGEKPVVFDQQLTNDVFDAGLRLPTAAHPPKRKRARLVVDDRARFLVDGRDIGTTRGLRVLREAVEHALAAVVRDATRSMPVTDPTDAGPPNEPHGSTRHRAPLGESASGDKRGGPGVSAPVFVRVEDAQDRFEKLMDVTSTGGRVVLTRAGTPDAALVSWSYWCELNADLARKELAYWSSWAEGRFDQDRYVELLADPHPASVRGLPHRRQR